MNITEAIWRHGCAWPDRVAVIYDGRPISYGALRNLGELVSARLAGAGVQSGDCVAVALKSPLAHLVTALAVARIGAVTTAMHAGQADEAKTALLARHATRWLVLDKRDAWMGAPLPQPVLLEVKDMFAPPHGGEMLKPVPVASDVDGAPWLIALSSGTTGTPKSVPLTHSRSLLDSALRRPTVSDHAAVVFVFTGLSIFMGIGNVLHTLLTGATLVLSSSANPGQFFEVVKRDRPTRVVTSTGTAMALVSHATLHLPQSLAQCASVQVIAVAGSAVSPALREGIAQRICPQIEINYGSTEAGALAQADMSILASHPRWAGRLHFWVQGEAVDEHDQPLAPGRAGILRFKAPTLAGGYLHDDEANAKVFRSGWYYPGDTGSVDQAGYLRLAGRVDDLLNLGGRKVDPVAIEQVLNSHPAIMESAVVAKPHESAGMNLLVAVVVLRPGAEVAVSELRRWSQQRLGPHKAPDRVVITQDLPKNEGGKLMRAEVAAALRIGRAGSEQGAPEAQGRGEQ